MSIMEHQHSSQMRSENDIYADLNEPLRSEYESPDGEENVTDNGNREYMEIYCTVPAPKPGTSHSPHAIHQTLHRNSSEHVAVAPVNTFGKAIDLNCSIHNEVLKFYCFEDATCICLSCCLTGVHKKHRIEPLLDASIRKKEEFRNGLQKQILQQRETDTRVQKLKNHRKYVQEKATNLSIRVSELFWDVRNQLDELEMKVLNDIAKEEEMVCHPISLIIEKLEQQKDELSRDISLIEELQNLSDPLTILGNIGKTQADFWLPKSRQSIFCDPGDLDEGLLMVTLQKSFDDIMARFKKRWCWASDLTLDVNTAANNIYLSGDRRLISWTKINQRRQKTPMRFKSFQVMSIQSFSSGQHYWEIKTGPSGSWMVGVCYPSIDRKGKNAAIGNSDKAWALGCIDKKYKVMHNGSERHLPSMLPYYRLGVYLDYDAGQLSFYEVSNVTRHIDTITTTFTEPVHAVFWVWYNWMQVNN